MQASSMSTPTAVDCGTIYVAIELSQKSWLITVHSPDRDRFSRHKLEGGDGTGLLALIEKARARTVEKLGSSPRVVSCHEAGYDGFLWLHRRLLAAGIENLVFDAASIAVEQRRRRAKTDRIDGELLLRTLMAHLRGEPRVVRIVRVPSVEEEDARRASRERDRLIMEQTAHTNRIKALLRLLGVAVGNPRRRDWLGPAGAAARLAGAAGAGASSGGGHARACPGLMWCVNSLGRWSRASLPRPLPSPQRRLSGATSCSGSRRWVRPLRPRWSTSCSTRTSAIAVRSPAIAALPLVPGGAGGIAREQGISKAGNRRARQKAIELAWLWLRHQPDSALSQWFRTRTANAGKRSRRVAIVALARKLIVALWRYLTTGLVPEEAVMKTKT